MDINRSEEFVLLYAMLDWDRFGRDAVSNLDESWFVDPFHASVISKLHDATESIDQNCLVEFVGRQMDRKEKIRISKWCTEHVWHGKNGRGHYDWHLNELRQARVNRMVDQLVSDVTDQLETGDVKVSDLRQQCEHLERESQSAIKPKGASCILEAIDANRHQTFIGSGFPLIDERIHGFRPGDLVVVGATPGMGKTSLALQMVRHQIDHSRTVIFASYEMSESDLMFRMVSSETRVPLNRLYEPDKMTREQRQSVVQAANLAESWPLHVLVPEKRTTPALRAYCDKVRERGSLGLVVVDYLQRLSASDPKASQYEAISQISVDLKNMAMDLQCPVLALCQLNRTATTERPRMSHLRGSGQIEQDADVIALIGPSGDDRSLRSIYVDKVRRGETLALKLGFDGPTQRWTEPNRVQAFDDFNSNGSLD